MGKCIVDSSCLIELENLGHLDLLWDIFEEVVIPPAVRDEIPPQIRNKLGKKFDWIIVKSPSSADLSSLQGLNIDPGETEAMALALGDESYILILDDKKARDIARKKGLKIVGLLGLLLRAKKKSLITEVKPILDRLMESDFRMTKALYDKVLNRAGED